MADPSRSDFSRLDARVRTVEPIADQVRRIEHKVDELHKALTSLVLFEERQSNLATRFRELAESVATDKRRAEQSAANVGERLEDRLLDLEKAHATLTTEIHGYVQRYVGISATVGGLLIILTGSWPIVSKLMQQ